jgi:hydrogenase maturation protein HypF
VRASVRGVVQGVGFRPFVHRLASRSGLAGWVRNDPLGVLLEAEGEPAALERFLRELAERPPRLAAVEQVLIEPLAATGQRGFRIVGSTPRRTDEGGTGAYGLVSPDVAPCDACLAELSDPHDRRHRYPFINCTDCGPRFTIVRGTPYDRVLTTMAAFEMCRDCRREYEDPADRRFHAEPNACRQCGPTLRLLDSGGNTLAAGEDPIAAAARALARGMIVALKGVGGYQLACRADEPAAVAELRRRKGRDEKPFALMTPDQATLAALIELSPAQARLAGAPERPIMIARRRPGAAVAGAVAPGLHDLGVMLPSTPLHHLLLGDTGATLVMTSGNLAGEPIVIDDDEALDRLGAVADLLLVHNRQIAARADDSVVRVLGDGPAARRGVLPRTAARMPASSALRVLTIRRARGETPRGLGLPVPAPPLLACGAELKGAFCFARGSRAWIGPHVGDLRSFQTLRSFADGVSHFEALLDIEPQVLAHDGHPDYLSTGYARSRAGVEVIEVQHHHAHFAAVLAEHGHPGPALGAIYDGAGFGSDGTVWGGELFVGDLAHVRRAGHLHRARLPGGDAAAREPWRMACSWLAASGSAPGEPPTRLHGRVTAERWAQVGELVRTGVASPLTSSVGRLFDGVAALCGIQPESREEGLAAMKLEAVADRAERGSFPLPVRAGARLCLDPRDTVLAISAELARGAPPAQISARFHNALADATACALAMLAEREGLSTVVLSGGVFQNRLLLERCLERIEERGLLVLLPRAVPPNDGGISYGQAAVAAARLA